MKERLRTFETRGTEADQDSQRKCRQSSPVLAGGWLQGLLVSSSAAGSCLAPDMQTLRQADRYQALLIKQRDIMSALTQRLTQRDEQIVTLQEELEAYDTNLQ